MYIANTFKKTTYWVGILVVGFLIGTSLQFAKAVWTEPGAAPPGGNVAGPLNTSTTLQTKNGTLNVNGFRNLGTTVLDGNVGIGTTAAGINNAKGAAGYVTAKDYYISDIGKWASQIAIPAGGDYVRIGNSAVILFSGAVTINPTNKLYEGSGGRYNNGVLQSRARFMGNTYGLGAPYDCDSGWVNGAVATCTFPNGIGNGLFTSATVTTRLVVAGAQISVPATGGTLDELAAAENASWQ